MKYYSLLFLIIISGDIFSQQRYSTSTGQEHLWGEILLDDLTDDPIFSQWYIESQDEYSPQINYLSTISNLDQFNVKIFLGTWCGDTKNWLPKFVELWREAGLSYEKLSFVALHNSRDYYKQSPDGQDTIYAIHRVPTFIFEDDEGKEYARIVESPMNSLEADLAQIALGVPSKPRYRAAQLLQNMKSEEILDTMDIPTKDLIRQVSRSIQTLSELTTLALKWEVDGDVHQAQIALKLAAEIYPFDPYIHYRLATFYYRHEEMEKSYDSLLTCLQIDPEYDYALKFLRNLPIQRELAETK